MKCIRKGKSAEQVLALGTLAVSFVQVRGNRHIAAALAVIIIRGLNDALSNCVFTESTGA